MKNMIFRLPILALSIVFLVMTGLGQVEDRDAAAAASGNLYVVSAKAGGTSYVEGSVTINRSVGTAGQLLLGDMVEVGDKVSTGKAGRAEILMNPGSFLRLDRNSEFEFGSTSLENLNVAIKSGSAILEVFASDDFKVEVVAGASRYFLVESGVYRVDVDSNGMARLEVWRGKARSVLSGASYVKKGRAAVTNGDTLSVSKFDKSKDEFEKWSEDRAKSIAKSNARLKAQVLGDRVVSSFQNYSWNCYDSIGLWVFNRQVRSFSFLPFGTRWRSPYGHRFGTDTSICSYPEEYWRRPLVVYAPRNPVNPSPATVPQANIDRARRIRTPPFQRMEQSGSVSRDRPRSFPPLGGFPSGGSQTRRGGTSGDSRGNSTTKTVTPAPAPAPAPAPSTRRTKKVDN